MTSGVEQTSVTLSSSQTQSVLQPWLQGAQYLRKVEHRVLLYYICFPWPLHIPMGTGLGATQCYESAARCRSKRQCSGCCQWSVAGRKGAKKRPRSTATARGHTVARPLVYLAVRLHPLDPNFHCTSPPSDQWAPGIPFSAGLPPAGPHYPGARGAFWEGVGGNVWGGAAGQRKGVGEIKLAA